MTYQDPQWLCDGPNCDQRKPAGSNPEGLPSLGWWTMNDTPHHGHALHFHTMSCLVAFCDALREANPEEMVRG